MKISTKGRYGVRIMLELALDCEQDLLTVRQIAQRQDISEKYIEQIISLLNKAGLVRSFRGAQGGYRLARSPHAITVSEILHVTEGKMNLVGCLSESAGACNRKNECITNEVWREMRDALETVAGGITLADLVQRHHRKHKENAASPWLENVI